LDRNPVLYTASLSILRFGIFRATKPAALLNDDIQPWKAAVLSVYEESDSRNPPEEVLNVHNSISVLADSLGTRPQFGSNVTVRAYNEHVSDASLVHFHGHAILATGADDQALILHESDSIHASGDVLRQASHHLTVRKIFSTTKFTHDPLVVNIACSSGSSMIMRGDEPFGLTAAFLYAGAKAVVGPLWSIRSADGRVFSNYFYENLRIQAAASETHVINLARAVQQSVLTMRDEEGTEAPFHWAAFILSGFWQHRFDPQRSRQQ
jgi:CHAT domain-containing protein